MGLVKNLPQINQGIDLWIKRADETWLAEYKDLVRAILGRLVRQTPQWTGNAAANWNVGIGSPDNNFVVYYDESDIGDDGSEASLDGAGRHKGHSTAVSRALRRNEPRIASIRRGDRVFFTNASKGDDDLGRAGTEYYLEAMQNPTYWAAKLRAVNKPYETVQESLIFAYERWGRKTGRASLDVGGSSWEDA